MVVFGESESDGRTAFLVAVSTVVGGALQFLIQKGMEWRSENRREDAAAQKTIVDHLQNLVVRLTAEKQEAKAEHDAIENRLQKRDEQVQRLLIAKSVMRRHIRYLESVLSRNDLSYEAYSPADENPDDDQTGPHVALPRDTTPNAPHEKRTGDD